MSQMRSLWHIVHKITDASLGYKYFDGVWFDNNGKQFTNEYKIIDWHTFNISKFEDSQILLLRDIYSKWWSVNIIVYSKKENKYTRIDWDEFMQKKNEKWWMKLVFS